MQNPTENAVKDLRKRLKAERCLPMGEVSGEGAVPPLYIFYFLSRYAAFWVQSDAFSDITRLVPNSLHSQPAESLAIIKPASATLSKGCRAF